MSANNLVARCFTSVIGLIGYVSIILVIALNLLVLCGIAVLVLRYAFGIELLHPFEWLPAEWRQK